jgi:hypothetical protein
MPVQGDGAEVRSVPEEVRGRVNHFASLWMTESFSVPSRPCLAKLGDPSTSSGQAMGHPTAGRLFSR